MKNPAQQLIDFGTSVWYDNIGREILNNGELKRLIAEWGVRGLTSNPTIFDKAISSGTFYDAQINELKPKGLNAHQMFEELAVADIAEAADLLLPIYNESKGVDGYVSIEVSPLLAADTQGSIDEGRKLFKRLARKNIMIKIPGTPEGLPAIKTLLEEGINVNVTLLFSVENYAKVAETYIAALEARAAKGLPLADVRSVASFFVSRVDTSVDKELDKLGRKELRGQFGVANCKLAYKKFQELFGGPKFAALSAKGALPQRPLWASTGTKDPAYKDTVYVDNLIGPDTVNTMPHQTLAAVVDHGVVSTTITKDVAAAESCLRQLTELGIDTGKILHELQVDGVKKFSESFESLIAAIQKKL